jgi:hypothetical protein
VTDQPNQPVVEPVETTPVLRVVKGEPTNEELAALVAVVGALSAHATDSSTGVRRSEWSAHTRKVRGVHRHGPGGWRASGLPG